jgi:WD40 repeat protein
MNNFNIFNETSIKIHNKRINSFLILKNDNRFLSSSEDSKIFVFDNKTFEIDFEINEFQSGILNVIQLFDLNLLCSDRNGFLILFKITSKFNYQILIKKKFDFYFFNFIQLKNFSILTCNKENKIINFNLNLEQIFTLNLNGFFRSLLEINNLIITTDFKNNKILFFENKNIIKEISNIQIYGSNKDLKIINKKLFLCQGINKLYFLNICTKNVDLIINFNNSINETLIINENNLLICEGNLLKFLRKNSYENLNWNLIFKIQLHETKISCLKIIKNYLISCAFNGEIKIWKINNLNNIN